MGSVNTAELWVDPKLLKVYIGSDSLPEIPGFSFGHETECSFLPLSNTDSSVLEVSLNSPLH